MSGILSGVFVWGITLSLGLTLLVVLGMFVQITVSAWDVSAFVGVLFGVLFSTIGIGMLQLYIPLVKDAFSETK